MSNPAVTQPTIRSPRFSTALLLLAATALYVAFAVYLYRPHFGQFTTWQWLLPVSTCLGAAGAFTLSRRWVAGFTGSFLAGAVYGFGPFLLGLAKFHASAAFLAACVPWLFVPAVLVEKRRGKGLGLPLLTLPFLAIVLFFYVSGRQHLFAAPLQAEIRPLDLVGCVAPLALADRSAVLLGFYHVPVAALVLGLVMVWKARRYSILVVLLAGLLLTFGKPLLGSQIVAWLGVSPLLWLSIPLAWCAVLSGIGFQGLIEAGPADKKWVLAAAITLGVLAILALLLAARCFQVALGLGDGYARLFVQAAQMYLLGAIAITLVFFMARQNLRWHALRWAVLCAVLGLDLFLAAPYIVDKVL